MAYWFSISGLQSALAHTSRMMPNPLFSFGTLVAIAGRNTLGMGFTLNIAPTSMAPVFPAEEKESISPFFSGSKPLAILELGFWVIAFVGCSCIGMASGA